MSDDNPKKPVGKIANTTHELILYDQLNRKDKELLEKSQIVLSQSKLHEIKVEEWKTHERSRGGQTAQSVRNNAKTMDKI